MPSGRATPPAGPAALRRVPIDSHRQADPRRGNARKAAYSLPFVEHVIAASPEIESSKASPSRSCHCSRVWTRSERPADCCKRELNLASRSAVLSVCNCWCIVGVERDANRGRRSRPCRPRGRVRPPSRDASGCRVPAGDMILFAAHCGTRVACLRREGRVLGGPIAPSKQTRTRRHANARRLHRRTDEH